MDFTECYTDTVSSVAAAARSGCRRQVRRLIERGCSVDCRDNRGWNALHEAAAAGNKECVQEILSKKAPFSRSRDYVNSVTHEGESACFLAAQRGHLAVVRHLLKARADINQLTNDLSCPLYTAVDNGHKDVVKLLVSKGAETNKVHTASCWTCLHQAVYKGHSDIVRILVSFCYLEAQDDHNITPLFVAAQYGQTECLEILIKAGASVNAQAADLATPLLIASQEGHRVCVDLLLDHGADPNIACSLEWPQLPIHAAAEAGHISILRRLIDVTDRLCDCSDGMVSPLYVAVHRDQSSSIELLLKEGYSPDAQDCTLSLGFCSPLSLALFQTANKSCSEPLKLLLTAGATLSAEEWMYALATDRTDLLELILEHKWIPQSETLTVNLSASHQCGKMVLKLQELRELLCVALSQVHFASCWISVLLRMGLDPYLLLHPHMLEKADSEVLNYLLEFVNWSTLSVPLKLILNQRRLEKTWEPCTYFDSVPNLFHICRLKVRDVLGPGLLMRTNVVRQLPVPFPLHDFLTFKDVQEPSYMHPPASPVINRVQRYRSTHQHRHVL